MKFPSIPFEQWQPSYDTLHLWARALSAVRRTLTPRASHWYHISLRVTANGLSTTPIPWQDRSFELALDLASHRLLVMTDDGEQWQRPLRGEPSSVFWNRLLSILADLDIHPGVPAQLTKPLLDDAPRVYNPAHIEPYWRALSQVDLLLKQFQAELRAETSQVQFWAHHFDLAMMWFSGRRVPGVDPANEEQADEQMNFGFSPGDAGIPQPYFYVTGYPLPEGWLDSPLPPPAQWHREGWNGAVLLYQELIQAPDPAVTLLEFWRTARRAGAAAMGGG